MLNFRHTNIVFGAALLVLMGWTIARGISFYWFVGLGVGYSLLLFYGSYYVGSDFYVKVICSGNEASPVANATQPIALSFDDGPAELYTPEILRILAEQGVEAAFFCIGKRAAAHEGMLRQIQEAGHIIGNHSYSHHGWFDLFSASRMTADLLQMNACMERATGLVPRLFRPPYGVTNPNLARAIARGGFTPVGWNIRSLDTVIKDEKKLLRRTIGRLKPGAIVLFHDTSAVTVSILPTFIKEARALGYECIRLDKLCNLAPYA